MTSAIYRITNTITGEFYIGMTDDFARRVYAHVRKLERGKHHSRPLQSSFDQHGVAAFRFEVVEPCDANDLAARERHWMETTKPSLNVRGGPPLRGLASPIEPGVARRTQQDCRSKRRTLRRLTRKQAVVCGLLQMGMGKAEIARSLGLTRESVSRTAGRARRSIGASQVV